MFFRQSDRRITFFNRAIDAAKHAGIIDRLFRKYLPHRDIKKQETAPEEKLTLEHFLIPYIVYVCGLSLALAVFTMEKFRDVLLRGVHNGFCYLIRQYRLAVKKIQTTTTTTTTTTTLKLIDRDCSR